ncbi:MAG: hypothetical protein SPI49_00070 [Eubacteriales bacterium]|nr:hypothetical protein [Eubacteriales bacterium]
MKKRSWRERLSYWFDCMMSKGAIAMSALLFVVTTAIVGVIGIVAYFISDDGGFLYQLWSSLMYTLDAGNLASVPTDNLIYLMLMFLATLCGLFLTSVLIGIIATGVENRLSNLRKGTSVVQENDHTVIIGFDNNVYTIIRELIEANSNKKKFCIVILGKEAKEEMEEAIASHIPDTKSTRIICRNGNLYETYALERCSVETSKSVIINVYDDAKTVKILLALSSYIKNKSLRNKDLHFIAYLHGKQYAEVANIAGEGRSKIVFPNDAIARIISNTCRQHGLSQVLTEILNFSCNEFYFEKIPELIGKTFKEAMLSFSNAVAVGLYAQDRVILNPAMDTIIKANYKIILLEQDDGAFEYHTAILGDETRICNRASVIAKESNNLIVFGSNDKLPTILEEFAKYVQPGTHVVVVDDDLDKSELSIYKNIDIDICTEAITRKLLCKFMDEKFNNFLLLNDDSQDPETSDSKTLLRLIMLRDIADKSGKQISITTEMRSGDNQRLASQARVDDFVIGSNIVCLIMAQLSENHELMSLFEELLDENGSELYMKPVVDYVSIDVPVDSYTLTESVARHGEIYLGYRYIGSENTNVVINPRKDQEIIFGERDQVVLIAKN